MATGPVPVEQIRLGKHSLTTGSRLGHEHTRRPTINRHSRNTSLDRRARRQTVHGNLRSATSDRIGNGAPGHGWHRLAPSDNTGHHASNNLSAVHQPSQHDPQHFQAHEQSIVESPGPDQFTEHQRVWRA
jgi:hypothetical protein